MPELKIKLRLKVQVLLYVTYFPVLSPSET